MNAKNSKSTVAHYKKLGVPAAWCGTVPRLSYDQWKLVTCPGCLARGHEVHGAVLPS